MPDEVFDIDTLPPMQQIIMDLLAARYRLGEKLWTLPSSSRAAVTQLEHLGLVRQMHGILPKTIRAGLTEAGKKASMSETYIPPALAKVQAADTLFTALGAFRDTLTRGGL